MAQRPVRKPALADDPVVRALDRFSERADRLIASAEKRANGNGVYLSKAAMMIIGPVLVALLIGTTVLIINLDKRMSVMEQVHMTIGSEVDRLRQLHGGN